MAQLPKLQQEITCNLPGYESVTGKVWINPPQKVMDAWNQLREASTERDERGRPVPLINEDTGEPELDDKFEPLFKVNKAKVLESSHYFMKTLLLEFSIDEDLDGNPISPADADFMERLPTDLISWVYDAVIAAVNARKEQGKNAVQLAGISGR